MKNDHFLNYFLPLGSFSLRSWAGQGVAYVRITSDDKSTTYSCVPNGF